MQSCTRWTWRLVKVQKFKGPSEIIISSPTANIILLTFITPALLLLFYFYLYGFRKKEKFLKGAVSVGIYLYIQYTRFYARVNYIHHTTGAVLIRFQLVGNKL